MNESKRGRPEHSPTPALRERVAIAAGAGMPQHEIALAIGVTRPTLAKHYADELGHGAQACRVDVLLCVYQQALSGSVAASRFYLCGLHRPAPAVGVKAQRNADAKTAQQGTEWQRLLPSRVQ